MEERLFGEEYIPVPNTDGLRIYNTWQAARWGSENDSKYAPRIYAVMTPGKSEKILYGPYEHQGISRRRGEMSDTRKGGRGLWKQDIIDALVETG